MSEHTMTENDLSAQIKKIQEHLGFIEKKLDTLIEDMQNRGNKDGANAFPRREFQRPFRPGGKGHFRPQGDRPYNARPQGARPYNNHGGPRPQRHGGPGGPGGHGPARHPQTRTWRPHKEK